MVRPTVTHPGAEPHEVAKTPTQKLVEDANRIVHVTDARGRKIGVRRLSLSVTRRVLKAFGTRFADNERYLRLYNVAGCVVTIDGMNVDPFESGATEHVFDNLLDRLDSDGLEAIGTALDQLNPVRAENEKEAIKNS